MKNDLGSSYIPQYLFMSYTNPSEQGYTVNDTDITMPKPMHEKIQQEVANSLVFDTKRRSIYAQGHEYGFIADTTSEVTVRNSTDDNSSTLILNVQDGVISLKEYIPASIYEYRFYFQTTNISGNYGSEISTAFSTGGKSTEIEIGTGIKITKADASFRGTNNVTSIKKTDLGGEKTITVDFPNSKSGAISNDILSTMDLSNCTDTKTDPGISVIRIACKDNRMTDYSGLKSFTIYWRYRVYVMDLAAASGTMTAQQVRDTLNGMSPADISTLMKGSANTTVGGLKVIKVYKNILASDKTDTGTITSQGGLNQYMVFFLPNAFTGGAAINAVFNESSTTDFKQVVTKSLTTNYNLTKQYDIYVAPADNWNNCTVKL